MFSISRRRVGGPVLTTGQIRGPSTVGTMRQAAADYPVPMGGTFIPTSRFQTYTQLTPVSERLERGTVAHDWIPRDTRTLNRVVRLIYLTDAVAGPAIDFYREVPFGPVVLGGIKDESRLRYYYEALDNLKLQRHLPYLAGDLLVVGRLIVHLLMNESKGMWEEMIVHDSDYIMVEPSPILGEEPTIDLMVPPGYQKWAVSPDPRIIKQRSRLDKNLIRLMAAGTTIPLSPENTIFIPRKASAVDYTGTSICMRILPIIAIEWAYLNAEVTGLRRRAAPWTIARMGIEEKWEPSPEEMQAVQDMLVAAEEDPVGAKLVLRNGIELDQVGGHSDLAKWLEQWPVLKEAKLQGLGMNEAFATGEASWSYLESMLSLGMERIRNFRQFMALEVIQEGVLRPLAKYNEFYKRSKAEIDHRIRTTKKSPENLDIPSVEWSRSLQPTADRDYLDILEMLEGKGLPINLRKWAQAGGYDIDEALDGADSDIELRKKLANYKKQIEGISGPAPDEGEEGGYGEGSFHAITERLAELPIWRKCADNEFLTLRRGDLPKFSHYIPLNGHKPKTKEWKTIEARMLDDGIRMSKINAFRYLLTRAGVIDVPLAPTSAVKVRDQLIRQANGKAPDRIMMKEIYWINGELEKQNIVEPETVVASSTPTLNTAPWVRPAGPKLLTGEGWEGPER